MRTPWLNDERDVISRHDYDDFSQADEMLEIWC